MTTEPTTRIKYRIDAPIEVDPAPKANDDYPKLGFEHNPRAWVLKKSCP